MSSEEFYDILNDMRGDCFHMTDIEASVVVDEYIEKYPELLSLKSREWLIHNS